MWIGFGSLSLNKYLLTNFFEFQFRVEIGIMQYALEYLYIKVYDKLIYIFPNVSSKINLCGNWVSFMSIISHFSSFLAHSLSNTSDWFPAPCPDSPNSPLTLTDKEFIWGTKIAQGKVLFNCVKTHSLMKFSLKTLNLLTFIFIWIKLNLFVILSFSKPLSNKLCRYTLSLSNLLLTSIWTLNKRNS